jgi:hypothetical protein
LNQLYRNRALVGNLGTSGFGSSSQAYVSSAWGQDFDDGSQYLSFKDGTIKNGVNDVRAVRAF